MGAYRKLHFGKKFIECLLIHAVDIGSCIHSNHYVVLVGPLGLFDKWEPEVRSLWSLGGFNMINYLKNIYPWWIWLSHSISFDVGVIIILGWCLDKSGSLSGPFLGLAYFVEVSYFMTVFALCILSWTFLFKLVLWLSTSHALSFHHWGFSRLMTTISRSMCSRIILSLILSTSSFLFVALASVLSTAIYSKFPGCSGI